MNELTFLDDLENRLKELEREIESIERKKNSYLMEDLMHEYDSAMDKTIAFNPVLFAEQMIN